MPQTRKIATCCYCGTRAVLVLNETRHELACSACGAPLREMKVMPVAAHAGKKPVYGVASPTSEWVGKRWYHENPRRRKQSKKDKPRRRKPLSRKLFEDLWEVVEDIFD